MSVFGGEASFPGSVGGEGSLGEVDTPFRGQQASGHIIFLSCFDEMSILFWSFMNNVLLGAVYGC